MDRDGDLDFNVSFYDARLNDGAGGFAQELPSVELAPPLDIQLRGPGYPGDFDGDGDVDLIGALFEALTLLEMRLFENNGSGLFEDGGPAADSGTPIGVWGNPLEAPTSPVDGWFEDLDEDGDVDIAVPQAGVVVVHWNDGNGFFSEPTVTDLVRIRGVADLDGDGKVDLYGFEEQGSTVRGAYLLGTSGPDFEPLAPLPPFAANAKDPIVHLDIENDGDFDLVVLNGSMPTLLRNSGAATFELDSSALLGPDGQLGLGFNSLGRSRWVT